MISRNNGGTSKVLTASYRNFPLAGSRPGSYPRQRSCNMARGLFVMLQEWESGPCFRCALTRVWGMEGSRQLAIHDERVATISNTFLFDFSSTFSLPFLRSLQNPVLVHTSRSFLSFDSHYNLSAEDHYIITATKHSKPFTMTSFNGRCHCGETEWTVTLPQESQGHILW